MKQPELICPECGERAFWQQYGSDGIGSAWCAMTDSHVPVHRRNGCKWTGTVIRNSDDIVHIATDEELAEIKKQPFVF